MAKLPMNFLDTIQNTDASLLAAMFMQLFEELYKLKNELIERDKELCKKEAEQMQVLIVNTKEAMKYLGMGKETFMRLCKQEKGYKLKIRTNACNGWFFDIDDLIAYKNHVFSENFEFDSYFLNPEFIANKGKAVTEQDLKRFNIHPKKQRKIV